MVDATLCSGYLAAATICIGARDQHRGGGGEECKGGEGLGSWDVVGDGWGLLLLGFFLRLSRLHSYLFGLLSKCFG